MSYNTSRPHLAVFVVIRKQEKIAFVLRSHTSWMDGYYGLPAGKVEVGEACQAAAVREVKEEAGITIEQANLKYLLTMHRQNKGDHAPEWIDIFFEATYWEGEPYNAEPEKHSEIAWLDPKNLPENIIPAVKRALTVVQEGQQYTEFGW